MQQAHAYVTLAVRPDWVMQTFICLYSLIIFAYQYKATEEYIFQNYRRVKKSAMSARVSICCNKPVLNHVPVWISLGISKHINCLRGNCVAKATNARP